MRRRSAVRHTASGSRSAAIIPASTRRSEEHTSELQSQSNLVCRLLLEKKKRPAFSDVVTAAHRNPAQAPTGAATTRSDALQTAPAPVRPANFDVHPAAVPNQLIRQAH